MKQSIFKNNYIRIILFIVIIPSLFYIVRVVVGVIKLAKLRQFSRITDSNQLEDSDTLGAYALPLLCDESHTTYDQYGVVEVDYSKTTLQGIYSVEYNPCMIAQFALCFYNHYKLIGSEDYKKRFRTQLDWLMAHYADEPSRQFAVWKHNFEVPQQGVNYKGWGSGLAQGVSISVLLRGYQVTGNKAYLTVAEKAVNAMVVPINQGGVAYREGDDLFFEEMPSGKHILNGDVFALLGVYEYWLVTKSDIAKDMVDENIATIRRWLPRYDLGYWSRYSLDQETFRNHWTIAAPEYHNLHIDMLEILYRISGDSYFLDVKSRWESYKNGVPFYLIAASKVVYTDFQLLTK